jgi:GNAT superfamily N-acetyltransferase
MTRFATPYGAYEIDSVPGQPQIAHCHSLHVRKEHRGKGLGHALKMHQMNVLRELGYDMATCTIDASNERQREVLEKAGWELLQNIPNSRTDGITQLWGWVVRSAA